MPDKPVPPLSLLETFETARRRQKLTYKALAQHTGLSELAVGRILQGKASPRLSSLEALADALGLALLALPREWAEGLHGPSEPAAPRVQTRIQKLRGPAGEGGS